MRNILKQIPAAILAIILVILSVTACSKTNSENAFTTDLEQFYQNNVTYDFPALTPASDEIIEALYPGLLDIARKQTVIYTPAISIVNCEIAMVETENPDDVDAVKSIFQTRIDNQVNGGAFYPDAIDTWKNSAKIVTRGNCVCLFVISDDLADLETAFLNL